MRNSLLLAIASISPLRLAVIDSFFWVLLFAASVLRFLPMLFVSVAGFVVTYAAYRLQMVASGRLALSHGAATTDAEIKRLYDDYQSQERKSPEELLAIDGKGIDWQVRYESALTSSIGKRKGRLLDVGCGYGPLLALAKKTGFDDVVGLDFTFGKLKSVVLIDGAGAISADAGHMPIKSGVFDSVTCVETLEHIEHPADALSEMLRVCRPDGRVAVVTPSMHQLGFDPNPFRVLERILSLYVERVLPAFHNLSNVVGERAYLHRNFTRKELAEMVDGKGRVVVHASVGHAFPNYYLIPFILLRRNLPRGLVRTQMRIWNLESRTPMLRGLGGSHLLVLAPRNQNGGVLQPQRDLAN